MALASVQASSRRRISNCSEVKIAFMNSKKVPPASKLSGARRAQKTMCRLRRDRPFFQSDESD
jgi:hypothetical protein